MNNNPIRGEYLAVQRTIEGKLDGKEFDSKYSLRTLEECTQLRDAFETALIKGRVSVGAISGIERFLPGYFTSEYVFQGGINR